MKDFNYWEKKHNSDQLEEFSTDEEGILWLKIKSIVRKELISEFILENSIDIKDNKLNDQFRELYSSLVRNTQESNIMLDTYIRRKSNEILAKLDTNKLVSELYKLKTFNWGGDYQNSLDKYLVNRYVKRISSYDNLVSKLDTEIIVAVQGYVLNSWYNHWSSILIESIFKSHNTTLPTIGQIKHEIMCHFNQY